MIDHGRLGEELEWKEMYLEEINQRLQRVSNAIYFYLIN